MDFSLHRSTSNQHEHYDYTNDSFIPPAPTFYNNLSFHEVHGTTEFGADYALPLSAMRSLKIGYALEQDDYRFSNVGDNVDPVTGAEVIDPTLTNDFKFRQLINAVIESFEEDVDGLETDYPDLRKFARSAREFTVYIKSNASSLINYGERYRAGERISSSLAESTVNAVSSKRFAKRQQMQWTARGAHLLLQTRTRALDGTLRPLFERWHPGLTAANQATSKLVPVAA